MVDFFDIEKLFPLAYLDPVSRVPFKGRTLGSKMNGDIRMLGTPVAINITSRGVMSATGGMRAAMIGPWHGSARAAGAGGMSINVAQRCASGTLNLSARGSLKVRAYRWPFSLTVG